MAEQRDSVRAGELARWAREMADICEPVKYARPGEFTLRVDPRHPDYTLDGPIRGGLPRRKHEGRVLDGYMEHVDPEIRLMAQAVDEGNLDALYALHDRLLELGQDEDATRVVSTFRYLINRRGQEARGRDDWYDAVHAEEPLQEGRVPNPFDRAPFDTYLKQSIPSVDNPARTRSATDDPTGYATGQKAPERLPGLMHRAPLSRKGKKRKLANPRRPGARGPFAPPGGLDFDRTYYQGGEALPPEVLAAMSPLDVQALQRAGLPLVQDPAQAQALFDTPHSMAGKNRKGEYPRPMLGLRDHPRRDPEVGPGDLDAYLLPDELGELGQGRGQQELVDTFNRLPPDREYVNAARAGRAKRGWYADASRSLGELFGEDAPRFAGLLAATSPVKSVGDNLANAARLWEHWTNRMGRTRDPEAIRGELNRLFTETPASIDARAARVEAGRQPGPAVRAYHQEWPAQGGYFLDTEINNIVRALSAADPSSMRTLSGPKVDSFRANLLGQSDRATNDVWMAAMAGVPQGDIAGGDGSDPHGTFQGTSPGYLAASAKLRRAAEALNRQLPEGEAPWTPAEVQEAIWSTFRAMSALAGVPRIPGKKRLGQPMDPEENLDALTHEFVNGNTAFDTLLTGTSRTAKSAQAALEQVPGMGERLNRLAGRPKPAPVAQGRVVEEFGPEDLDALRNVSRRAALTGRSYATPTADFGDVSAFPLRQARQGSKRRLARPGEWSADRIQLALDHHEPWLQSLLLDHPDPEVKHLVEAVMIGQGSAAFALYDRLQELGSGWADLHEARSLAHMVARDSGRRGAIDHSEDLLDERQQRIGQRAQAGSSYAPYDAAIQDYMETGIPSSDHPQKTPSYTGDQSGYGTGQKTPEGIFGPSYRRGQPLSRKGRKRRYSAPPPATGFAPVAQPAGATFSSENKREDLDFDQALQRTTSGDQKVFREMADSIAVQMGLKPESHNAVGDWEDGAEHSVVSFIPQRTDMGTLRALGAWQGLMGNQRSVLVFNPEPQGLDSVYDIKVPETDAGKVRQRLSQAGIPFRTIVPGKDGSRVVIYDQKRQLRDKVAQFAGMYGAGISESIGSGEYVGGGSRSAARAKYRQIIAEYETRTGRQFSPGQASGAGGRGSASPAQA